MITSDKHNKSASANEHGIKITSLPLAARARIVSIAGDRAVWKRLHEVGLHIGDLITVSQHAPFRGPLLVNCNGHEIALGRSIAAKIFVQVVA